MNIFKSLFLTILVMMSTPVYAKEYKIGEVHDQEYRGVEVPLARIRQSNDGTGIIQGVTCEGCDFKFVKITLKTKVIKNGKVVDLLTAREYAGKLVYVVFDDETAEVIKIYL